MLTSAVCCLSFPVLIVFSWVSEASARKRPKKSFTDQAEKSEANNMSNNNKIFNAGLCSLVMASTSVGLGRKASEVSAEHYAIYLKLMTVCSICFSFGCALAKCSFAVLYLRLIPNRYVQILNKCLIFYMFCQAIEETLVNVFQCQPVAKAWDPKIKGSCINIEIMWWVGVSCFSFSFFLSSLCGRIPDVFAV